MLYAFFFFFWGGGGVLGCFPVFFCRVSGRLKLMGKQDADSLPEALDMRAEIQVVVIH